MHAASKVAVPVHDYWLEHRRALIAELGQQREEMLRHVSETQKSAFLGLDLLKERLERSLVDIRSESRHLLDKMQATERKGWLELRKQQENLFAIQQGIDDQLVKSTIAAKELHMKQAEEEAFLTQRRADLERWAATLQKELMSREHDLGLKTRAIERDMAYLTQAKQKDLPRVNQHVHHFAKITAKDGDAARVVAGQSTRIAFQVTPHAALIGMPAIITYLEGKDGVVQGHIVAIVEKDGFIKFDNIIVQGKTGTSHVLLVSMPRMAAGTVESCELTVHLLAPPDIRASGYWVISQRKLVGRIRVAGIETFGLLGVSINISMNVCHQVFNVTAKASETNEFPFEFDLGKSSLSWDSICEGKAVIETQVPVTKYTTAFFHRFEVKLHSETFPTFQFPARDNAVDCGVGTKTISIPHSELVTEVHTADSGRLVATSDVSGTVKLFILEGANYRLQHVIEHASFVSRMCWSGSHIALLEPRQQLIHIWSLSDLSRYGEIIPKGSRPTHQINRVPSASLMAMVAGTNPMLVIVSNNALLRLQPKEDALELLPASVHAITQISSTVTERHGQIVIVGYGNGKVILHGVVTNRHIFSAQIETKDAVTAIDGTDPSTIIIATATGISVLRTDPCGISTSAFRSPSSIGTIALCRVHPRGVLSVLLVHSDGNLCVVELEEDHVLGYGKLRDVSQPISSLRAVAFSDDEFRVVGCRSLDPVAWGVKLTPKAEANRKTRDATFEQDDADASPQASQLSTTSRH